MAKSLCSLLVSHCTVTLHCKLCERGFSYSHLCFLAQLRINLSSVKNKQSRLLYPLAYNIPNITTVFEVVPFLTCFCHHNYYPFRYLANPLKILFAHSLFCPFRLPLKWILVGCFGAPQAQDRMNSRLEPHFLPPLQPQPGAQSLHPV